MATDACIWTPGVVVVKRDGDLPEAMPGADWFECDVVTCAAPNLRRARRRVPGAELRAAHLSRARRVLAVAAAAGARTLVLGAFGCGAFANDPRVVASAWHEATEEARAWFDAVEFAVWCPPGGSANRDAFLRELS